MAWDIAACVTGEPRNKDQYGNLLDKVISGVMFRLIVLEFRADWPAWAELSGVRIWKHALFPCPKCDMPLADIKKNANVGLITFTSVPWTPYTHEQYLEDIRRQTIDSCILCSSFYKLGDKRGVYMCRAHITVG